MMLGNLSFRAELEEVAWLAAKVSGGVDSLNMNKPRTMAGQRPPFSQRMGVGTGEIEMRSLGITN